MPFADCRLCREPLTNLRGAAQHFRRWHPDEAAVTCECQVCGKAFTYNDFSVFRRACSRVCGGRLTIRHAAAAITAESYSQAARKRAALLWANKEAVMQRRYETGFYDKVSAYMKAGGVAKAKLASCRGRPSKPQLEMFRMVQTVWPEAALEHPVGSRVIDVAVPSLRLAMEYDGTYWHQDAQEDALRDAELHAAGWSVGHFRSLEEVEVALRWL